MAAFRCTPAPQLEHASRHADGVQPIQCRAEALVTQRHAFLEVILEPITDFVALLVVGLMFEGKRISQRRRATHVLPTSWLEPCIDKKDVKHDSFVSGRAEDLSSLPCGWTNLEARSRASPRGSQSTPNCTVHHQ
jgi:hypothetical protein